MMTRDEGVGRLPAIGLVAALPEEARPIRRALTERSVVRTGEWRFDQGLLGRGCAGTLAPAAAPVHAGASCGGEVPADPRRRAGQRPPAQVIVVRSGMGRARAALACAALMDHFSLACVVAVGFAGALRQELAPGALLWADVVLAIPDPERAEVVASFDCLQAPPAARRLVHTGALVTTDRVLSRAAAKEELGRRCPVPVATWSGRPVEFLAGDERPMGVDMESAGVAEVAAARGVPFAAIRVVTDALGHDLPLDFNACVGPRGDVRGLSVAAQLARRPRALPGILRLGHHSLSASRRLAAFLAAALPQLP
jgi:adenosylhomocysteine nucleosidase